MNEERIRQFSIEKTRQQVHIIMTTYREKPERHALFQAAMASLATRTRVPATLWLMDEGAGEPLSAAKLQVMLAGSSITLGALCRAGRRIGQAAQFNRGYALVEDCVRQQSWPWRLYLVKTEDDFEFTEAWLARMIATWEHPTLAGHNIGMLGGANGEPGDRVPVGEETVRITYHVAAGCMFAPLALWRDYLPVPPRPAEDVQGGEPPTLESGVDWMVTRRGLRSVSARGRRCALLEDLIIHRGRGQSTWMEQDRQ